MKICEPNLEVKHVQKMNTDSLYLFIYLSGMYASKECVNFYRDCCKKQKS